MNTYEAALREIEKLLKEDKSYPAHVKAINIARKALAVPAPPVEYYKPDMMGAVTITGEPIAAPPSAQEVEAGDFAERASAAGWKYRDDTKCWVCFDLSKPPISTADLLALYKPAKSAARQDQGVVGTQGREEFINKVINFSRDGYHKFHELAGFMRAHWPVSEGEGMRPVEPAADLPDIHVGDIPENSAPVDPVALLEWVAGNSWEWFYDGYWRKRTKVGLIEVDHAALIQEFINQKTKEV